MWNPLLIDCRGQSDKEIRKLQAGRRLSNPAASKNEYGKDLQKCRCHRSIVIRRVRHKFDDSAGPACGSAGAAGEQCSPALISCWRNIHKFGFWKRVDKNQRCL